MMHTLRHKHRLTAFAALNPLCLLRDGLLAVSHAYRVESPAKASDGSHIGIKTKRHFHTHTCAH